jgi:hypothetical protein
VCLIYDAAVAPTTEASVSILYVICAILALGLLAYLAIAVAKPEWFQ